MRAMSIVLGFDVALSHVAEQQKDGEVDCG